MGEDEESVAEVRAAHSNGDGNSVLTPFLLVLHVRVGGRCRLARGDPAQPMVGTGRPYSTARWNTLRASPLAVVGLVRRPTELEGAAYALRDGATDPCPLDDC